MENLMTITNEPDYSILFHFEDGVTGEDFTVSLATLLQCLCIADHHQLVPPLDQGWTESNIPPILREITHT